VERHNRGVPLKHALVVEDDLAIQELLRSRLETVGFEVQACVEGTGALRLLQKELFDLVVLDVMLPGLDGVSICQAVRLSGPNVSSPILMVTARHGESDKVLGLESGADDYLAKPFGVRELLARVIAITRRHERAVRSADVDASTPATGPVQIDPEKRIVNVRGRSVELTRQEFDLLYRLITRRGVVFNRASLIHTVWQDDGYVTERTVDAVISRIRKKIENDPREPELILTAWGVGYKFADTD
jgi:two-component system OmpR family response regulator